MESIKLYLFLVLCVALSACGGGGSSSGGGVAPAPVDTGPPYEFGSYGGSETVTISVPSRPDLGEDTVTGGFLALVENGRIELRFIDFQNQAGPINAGGNFNLPNITTAFSLDDGTPCRGEFGYQGRVFGTSMEGTSQGSLNCAGITFRLVGTFTAELGADPVQGKTVSIQTLVQNLYDSR